MSASHSSLSNGKSVILVDVNTDTEITFDTIASLGRELGVSNRTINRWALNGKVHRTNSVKYPVVKLKLSR